MTALWQEAFGSGVWAALIAMLVCALIERFGGAVGGVLATVPGTITPASIGMWLARKDVVSFRSSMASAPVGLLVNAGFLTFWRYLPYWVERLHLRRSVQLLLLVGGSLTLWALLAIPVMVLVSWLRHREQMLILYALGTGSALLVLVVGVAGTWHTPKSTSRASGIPWWMHPVRALLAFFVVTAAVWLSHQWPALAGILAVWPAVFLTTMVALWWSHGGDFQTSAAFPMILGLWAPMLFCGLVCFLYPRFDVSIGCILSWLLAVALGTIPLAGYIRWRQAAVTLEHFPVNLRTAEDLFVEDAPESSQSLA
jgi:hypothetical protein